MMSMTSRTCPPSVLPHPLCSPRSESKSPPRRRPTIDIERIKRPLPHRDLLFRHRLSRIVYHRVKQSAHAPPPHHKHKHTLTKTPPLTPPLVEELHIRRGELRSRRPHPRPHEVAVKVPDVEAPAGVAPRADERLVLQPSAVRPGVEVEAPGAEGGGGRLEVAFRGGEGG
ncbi:hypothetical protein BV22DRAFT_141418 [Leucogyrophana mollusca]|uniref:Uncharacterized protein n=1 Tax=Leucogyrophana mollusca TaxID=85980 RepID=A0ACB8BV01_9AGAM|nr:hypothetical protein BV22DRAFT_141418 [Leucogyrophana mollusca]